MSEGVDLLVDALATYRLSRLLIEDSIFDKPRTRALAWADEHHPKLSEWASCYWCSGLWFAAGVIVARRVMPRTWSLAADVLAASAVAGLISERALR